ncbi:MAG TPA: cation diffusion facilitator family transporter [Chloroflexota bacterium]|nr:cation diffusion facilitator family transporter [Chloroflexota bacterium]
MHVHGTGERLKLSALFTAVLVAVELAIGWWAHSLALMADAGHNLTDVLALVLSAWAFAMASRPADPQRTFGYHRVGVLAALANALTLVILAAYIFVEGYHRLRNPEPVASLPMIALALVAFAFNGGIVLLLHRSAGDDVNVRSAVIHMAGDAVSSLGVVVAGVLIMVTGVSVWDPLASLLIGVFIVYTSWGIIVETVNILLEGTPVGLRVDLVVQDIEQVPGVKRVHDLHTWTLGPSVRALSAHLELTDPVCDSRSEVMEIVREVKSILATRHRIAHATLETHCSDCAGETVACQIVRPLAHAHDHQHDHSHPGHRH